MESISFDSNKLMSKKETNMHPRKGHFSGSGRGYGSGQWSVVGSARSAGYFHHAPVKSYSMQGAGGQIRGFSDLKCENWGTRRLTGKWLFSGSFRS
jgi:hypothetical protein